MRKLVYECRKLLSRRLARQQCDPATCRSARGRRNVLRVFESDAPLSEKFRKAVAVLASVAGDASDCRQFLASGLSDTAIWWRERC